MDVNGLKGRIGEALVESILRQCGYKISRLGRESQVHRLLKSGTSEFLPDFLIWKPVERSSEGAPLHRLFSVEVKYRANVETYLSRFGEELVAHVGDQWRELYVVLVTDHPESGRSCFQVLDVQQSAPDTPLGTVDLHDASVFGIGRSVIEQHEKLVHQLFAPLGSDRLGRGEVRRPLTRISPENGNSVQRSSSPAIPA